MYHVRNALRILLVLTVIVAASVATVSAAGYVIGSATKPVSVSNAAPTSLTALDGSLYAVGGASPAAILMKYSKANKLGLLWDDTAPAAPWNVVNPAKMKGMSVVDPTSANWGLYLAGQTMYDASAKNFNWNGAQWVNPTATEDVDFLVCGVVGDLNPGTAVGNAWDKGVWLVCGYWPGGAALPPANAPSTYVAIFLTTGQAPLRIETTYPTMWWLNGATGYPWHYLNMPGGVASLNTNSAAPGQYDGGITAPPDVLLYMDNTKVKERFTINGVYQGTNYAYVSPDTGATAPFFAKEKSAKVTIKNGVAATAKFTLK